MVVKRYFNGVVVFLFIVFASGCETRDERTLRVYNEKESVVRSHVLGVIEDAGACERDTDCVRIIPGCPLGCGAAINKDHFPLVVKQLERYFSEYPRCLYKCKIPDSVSCTLKKCTVQH